MAMSFVADEFRPSFSSVRVIVTCSVSRMNADTPRALRVSLSVRANRSTVPPSDAFVIHCFAPVSASPRRPPPPASSGLLRRSPTRLGQREAADPLAARERRHEARALLVGAELEERQRARGRVHGDRHADAGVARARAPRARGCTRGSPRRRRRTPPARTRPSARARRASRSARAESRGRGPTRRHAVRSRRVRSRGRATGSRAAPA